MLAAVPWTREDMAAKLHEFAELYAKRPILDNQGGMNSAHLFPLWFLLQRLKPKFVIESGVWRGLGTWVMEQAYPAAQLICIDINWKNLRYRSPAARYVSQDITVQDWSGFPKAETVVFFDDHIDALQRLRWCADQGFRHVVFEDNYPPGRGDCYSIKKAMSETGHRAFPGIKAKISRFLGRLQDREIAPNATDAAYIRQRAEVVAELPPVFTRESTRWGDSWSIYPTVEPLLRRVEQPYQQVYFDEAQGYTWMCYVRLKSCASILDHGDAQRSACQA